MRQRIIIAVVVVAAIAGAFVGGRFSAPLKTEVKEVEKVIYKDRVIEKVVTVTAKAETKVVYRDRVITKDGTVTEREIEKTDSKEDSKTTADKIITRDVFVDKFIETKTTLRPDWRVSVLAGASIREPLVPVYGPIVVGIQVDRRIIGGLSAGVWINTFGAAGVGLSFEF